MTAALPEESIVRRTLVALLEPKRLGPIVLVCVPLLFAQRSYSRHPDAVWVGLALCITFVLVAPVSYRVLFPDGLELTHGAIRLLLYAAIGAGAVMSVGSYGPRLFGIEQTFLTAHTSLLIDIALFLAGGWGLGRDIGMEASLVHARQNAERLLREAERAQLLALKANLDPHFLFNTLSAIAEWCRVDGATAERGVLELAALLRAVLAGVKEPAWPLARELEICRALLSLHRLRDPDRFEIEWKVDERAGAVLVPPMLLFPLVENAVTHGPGKGHRGVIRVAVTTADRKVTVRIDNPGEYAGARDGSHGLPTIEKRLELAYDGRASLDVCADGEGTRATLVLPMTAPEVAA